MRSHPLDVVSLLMGLLFTGFAAAYAIGEYADVSLDPRYLLPVFLVAIGVAGLVGSLVAQRRADRALVEAKKE